MKNLIALSLMLFATQIWAEDATDRFRRAALKSVEEAEQLGDKDIGGIPIEELKAAIKKVKIEYQPGIQIMHGNRRCASWQAPNEPALEKLKLIRLNEGCAQLLDGELKGIALHEVLGVAYRADKNYQITAPVLSRSKLTKAIPKEKKALPTGLTGGGSTGVGGGGDLDDLNFKVIGLRKLDELAQTQTHYDGYSLTDLVTAFTEMNIGPAKDIQEAIEYRGPQVEGDNSKTYILTSIYRSADADTLARLALKAAVLELRYGAKGFKFGRTIELKEEDAIVRYQL